MVSDEKVKYTSYQTLQKVKYQARPAAKTKLKKQKVGL